MALFFFLFSFDVEEAGLYILLTIVPFFLSCTILYWIDKVREIQQRRV